LESEASRKDGNRECETSIDPFPKRNPDLPKNGGKVGENLKQRERGRKLYEAWKRERA